MAEQPHDKPSRKYKAGRGRHVSFNAAQRRAALEARAEGMSEIDCAAAAGVTSRTVREWLLRGEGNIPMKFPISDERRALSAEFFRLWQEATEKGNALKLARAAEWKARRAEELEAELDKCVDTALRHGTTGYPKRIVAITEKRGAKTITTTVEDPVPSYQAALRALEVLAPERHGRISRLDAAVLKKREASGETIVTREQAKARARELLARFSPSDLEEILEGLPRQDAATDDLDLDDA